MKKKIKIIIVTAIFLCIIVLCTIIIIKRYHTIEEDYIVCFYGGSGEFVYFTYIYEISDGQTVLGYKYINAISETTNWGSSEWKTKVISRGKIELASQAFEIAHDNGAYSYIKLPNSDETYSIETFKNMHILN